jgi:hypothetical protein
MSRRQRRRVEKRRRDQGNHEGHLGRSLATGAGVTVGATLLMGGAAQAATLTVGSTADTTGATDCAVATNTDCTLRDAIEDANAAPGSTITFASGLTGAITLNGTELPQITGYSTVIQGPSGGITIDGDYNSRIFNVSATDARISGLTVTHGSNAGPGGGIYLQAGQLTLTNVVLTDNDATGSSGHGGGIAVNTGTLTLDSSTISGNDAGGNGGGVYTEGSSSGGVGGGGPATIRNSTVSGNNSNFYGGGAYFNYQSSPTVSNSTIYDNGAGAVGGGLYHFGEPNDTGLVVTGSTITHNTADRGGGVGAAGVGLGLQPRLRNTIVAGNTAADGADVSANDGTIDAVFSLLGSLDSETTIGTPGTDVLGQDPQLGPLANNGGATQTQKPATTSPVVDAGSAFGLTSDQRGLARPFDAITANAVGGDASDIGAVELQVTDLPAAPTPAGPTPPGSTTPPTPTKRKKCKKKKHKRSAESAKKKKCKKKKPKK